MAQPPILYDFQLALSDTDRALSEERRFKLARHPSETMERVWLRLLAYCWKFEDRLAFGPGLSDTEAPDLLTTDLTGLTTRWIRVGKAEPAKIQRAVDQHPHAQVSVLFESPLRLDQFLAEAHAASYPRLARAELAAIDANLLAQLARSEERRNKLTVTLVGEQLYIDLDGETLEGFLHCGRIA